MGGAGRKEGGGKELVEWVGWGGCAGRGEEEQGLG